MDIQILISKSCRLGRCTAQINKNMDLFVTAQSIRDWADTLDARSNLPHIVRRLVSATTGGVVEIDFPAHESTQRPGFDGVVECKVGNSWVPVGRSVWELSAEDGVSAKADRDFKKRTQKTPEAEQRRCFYIFLTPRRFNSKRIWAEQKTTEGQWLGIRAYDADDLEQWIEMAPPGLIAWCGRQIGSRPFGIDYIGQHWSSIANVGEYQLVPQVFLAGREKSVEKVEQWLTSEPRVLRIDSRSPTEVVDFFCATVAAMQDEGRIATESRAILIHDLDDWHVLRDSSVRAILIVDPKLELPTEQLTRAVSNGHHVLVASEPTFFAGNRDTALERAKQFELTKALEQSGYGPAKAEQYARAAGGSLAILRQQLIPPESKRFPEWAAGVSSEVVTACLLLGGWESIDSDQSAFEEIAGRDYGSCQTELQRMANSKEPLLLHALGKWRLISKDHAWSLFEDRVSPHALQRFEPIARDILVDDDPRYTLPEGERFYANLRGHVPTYSESLKKHVTETLAFLGAFGSRFTAASSVDISATVNRVVAEVLSPTCTWHRWASLGARLALLAEASPASFLRAVREDLDKQTPELVKLLMAVEKSIFGRCNHAGLLWALEGLAWPRRYLGEVVEHLVVLAAHDEVVPSNMMNRPKNSIREILSYWMPHTTANVDERIQVLDLLIRRDRRVAWNLLLELLPEAHGGFSHPTHKPYWRDWADEWERGVTIADSTKFVTAVAERILDQVGSEISRWADLFGKLDLLPYTVRDRLVEAVKSFAASDIEEADRRLLSEELSRQVNRHRQYGDAEWSLPKDVVDELDSALELLKPKSSILRNASLFDQWPEKYLDREGGYAENQKLLDIARQEAIKSILDEYGFEGIEALVEQAGSPANVGHALSVATHDQYLEKIIPSRLEGEQKDLDFAGGFIWNRYWTDGWTWGDATLPHCNSDRAKARFLTALPFSRDTWIRVERESNETSQLYWSKCRAQNSEMNSADVKRAVESLVAHGRSWSAVDILSMALYNETELEAETLLKPLESLSLNESEDCDARLGRNDGHHLVQIIEALQKRSDVDESRLLRIEWTYLRLLDRHNSASPRTLEHKLSTSPEFFIEVLCSCFRPHDHAENETKELSQETKYMAEQGFRLLHDWGRVPGTVEDQSIHEGELRNWCNEARRLAHSCGRLEVCDNYIGQVFAKSRLTDENGSWPCASIRVVASEIKTESLESGLYCGIMNLREAGFRGPSGDQERKLEADFRGRAEKIRFDSPFISDILESVADSYSREAHRWDEIERSED